MRILADENVPRPIVAWLRDTGHDVLYSAESRSRRPTPICWWKPRPGAISC